MRALDIGQIRNLREQHQRATCGTIHASWRIRKGYEVADRTEPSGRRLLTDEEVAIITGPVEPTEITPASCPHMNFEAHVEVARIQSEADPNTIVAYHADIRICCHECGQGFEFIGLPLGMSYYQPTVSINGQEMRVPLVLPGTMPPPGLAGFSVSSTQVDEKEARKQ